MAKDDEVTHLSTLLPRKGRSPILCTLIDEFKCNPNTKGSKGRTILHYAAQNGHVDIVRKLVREYGSVAMAKDDNGDTPLYLATLGGHCPQCVH